VLSPDRRRDAEGGRVPLAEVPKHTYNLDVVEVLLTAPEMAQNKGRARKGTGSSCLHEVSVTLPRGREEQGELLRAVFLQLGVPGEKIAQTFLSTRLEIKTYLKAKSRADRLLIHLRSLGLKGARCCCVEVHDADWKDKWKTNIKPFSLGRRFFVVPLWHKARAVPRGRRPIYLDTDLAFGTGAHETTRFMAQLIETCEGRFRSFLDIGTGTGLLAIVAAYCGAARLSAVDYDPQCVRVARENIKRNNVKNCLLKQKDLRKMRAGAGFDLVAANLTSQDLIAMRRKILSQVKSGGYLIVSGIFVGHLKAVQKAFRELPLRCLKIMRGQQWTAVKFKRIR